MILKGKWFLSSRELRKIESIQGTTLVHLTDYKHDITRAIPVQVTGVFTKRDFCISLQTSFKDKLKSFTDYYLQQSFLKILRDLGFEGRIEELVEDKGRKTIKLWPELYWHFIEEKYYWGLTYEEKHLKPKYRRVNETRRSPSCFK